MRPRMDENRGRPPREMGDSDRNTDRPRNQERRKERETGRHRKGELKGRRGKAHVGEGNRGSRPGLGEAPVGKGPQVTAAPPPPASWAAHLSRVTPEAPCPLPGPVGAAVGGAGGETPELSPSTLGCSLATPIPRASGEEGVPARPGRGWLCWGTRPVLGVLARPSRAPLTLTSPGTWLLSAFLPSHPNAASFGISKPCS